MSLGIQCRELWEFDPSTHNSLSLLEAPTIWSENCPECSWPWCSARKSGAPPHKAAHSQKRTPCSVDTWLNSRQPARVAPCQCKHTRAELEASVQLQLCKLQQRSCHAQPSLSSSPATLTAMSLAGPPFMLKATPGESGRQHQPLFAKRPFALSENDKHLLTCSVQRSVLMRSHLPPQPALPSGDTKVNLVTDPRARPCSPDSRDKSPGHVRA